MADGTDGMAGADGVRLQDDRRRVHLWTDKWRISGRDDRGTDGGKG
jgi:hypothetical protein